MSDTNTVALRIEPNTKDLGEFSVARLLPDRLRNSSSSSVRYFSSA